VITHDTFSIQFKLCDKEIRRQIEKLRSSITTSPVEGDFTEQFNKFTSSSKYLYDELITPVYDQIKGKRLIIIPHNELTLIPFEALISNIPKDRDFRNLPYLIKEFPVVYAYSANFLLDQGKNKKYGKGTAVFLPDYDTWENSKGTNAFNSLQGAKNEAKRIRKITGGRIFSGSKATEAMFKRKAPLYRIIHIASHALLNEENPNLSSLVFNKSDDSINEGYLYSFELRQMKLNAQLVVLSGCNTGYGKLRISEGLVSLSRSLFYTNVRTVAFTLWSVADNSGSILVTNFYKGLYKKQLLDIAMRNAKLDFLKNTDPVRTHPYYWANFMVVGKTENIPVHPPFNRIWFVLLSLIGATTAVFLFRKFRA
jgi:CHAT domain-containing protein